MIGRSDRRERPPFLGFLRHGTRRRDARPALPLRYLTSVELEPPSSFSSGSETSQTASADGATTKIVPEVAGIAIGSRKACATLFVILYPLSRTEPHALNIGPTTITGLMLQWQDGKQVNLWPANVANGKLKFPKFIKVGASN